MTDAVDLTALLKALDDKSKAELDSTPTVEEWKTNFNVSDLPIEARKWIKVPDLVAVVADLKNSTKLGTGKHASSTASIYEAATGGAVSTLNKFQADFIQIQGDGAFGLFWGDRRFERAMCAGITIKTFSEDLVGRLEKKWPDAAPTGFKVGVASGRVLVKKVGTPRNLAEQEPVWAGKPVNYAAKAAQAAERHELIVTGSVWDQIENNEYLTMTCGCGKGPSAALWNDVEIGRLPDDDERFGRKLTSKWCAIHGAEYCDAIMQGQTTRDDDTKSAKEALSKQLRSSSLRLAAQQNRRLVRNRRLGLAKR